MEIDETTTNRRVIVVGVDASAKSDLALLTAIRMCDASDTLHVVHAVEVSGLSESKRIQDQASVLEHDPERVRAYLNQVCEREEVWPRVRPEVHTRIGAPVAVLVQFCTDVEADLLVCGTHRQKAFDRLRTPVTEGLMHDAPCPVLVAKTRAYQGRRKSELPAPPCADCVATREETGDATAWCSTHSRDHRDRHTYSGAGARGSIPPGVNMR